ncbi:MAG: hypothetical protein M0P43_10835 [Arcobacteraceae bacterium]|nr:hypothetical protein [Arcobacteraceae bacterium]
MASFGPPKPKKKTISNNHTLSGLVKEYKDTFRELKRLKRSVKAKETQVKKLYDTIKLIEPSYNLEKETAMAYTTKRKFFEIGECKRLCVDILRNSDKDMTIGEIMEEMVIIKEFDLSYEEQNTIDSLYKTIANSIRALRSQEFIQLTANGETSNVERTYRILKENGLFLKRAC